jgi:protein-tyrosine phosphatase
LLTLFGVPKEVVFEDFMRSNEYYFRENQKGIDDFVKAGGEATILRAILGVEIGYLKAGFAEMKDKYGTIENYFSLALGIDVAGQKALRKRLLTRAG